jgi:hypothetical protein
MEDKHLQCESYLIKLHYSDSSEKGNIFQLFVDIIYRVIPSVLDPKKCEYLKEYSLFNLIFCKYILYL